MNYDKNKYKHTITFGKTQDGMSCLLEYQIVLARYAEKNKITDKIVNQLAIKGIYEDGDYSIQPLNIGDYSLFTVKYRNSSVSPIYDNLKIAVKEFLKLTN